MSAKSGFSTPAQQGWCDGNAARDVSCVPQTGKPPASAKATRPALAAAGRSSPSSTTTRSGSRPASFSARRAASGEGPSRGGEDAGGVGWFTSWSRMSIGSDRNTGPHGGVRASPNARRSAGPTSSPRRSSFAHLVTGVGEGDEVAREPRLGHEMPCVLLAGGDDERRLARLGGDQHAHGVAEAAHRVQVDEGGAARGERPAVGHADRGRLLQAEHVANVRRVDERVHERHLGRAGIAEDVGYALIAQDVDENVARASGHLIFPLVRSASYTGLETARMRGAVRSAPGLPRLGVSCAAAGPGGDGRMTIIAGRTAILLAKNKNTCKLWSKLIWTNRESSCRTPSQPTSERARKRAPGKSCAR